MSNALTPTPPDELTAASRYDTTPSDSQETVPTLSRIAGMVGLFLLTVGAASVIAAENYDRGPLGAAYGYLAGTVGLALLLIHALRDPDVEIRRMYGGFGLFLLATGVLVSAVPGDGKPGAFLLPWGFAAGVTALLFLIPFAFCGFAPGFAYLEGADDRLVVPRRETPRTEVPAGSVGLADGYSGIYPRASPGGWQLIGTTTAVLWDVEREPPALLRPGWWVQFVAVDR